MGEYVGTVRMDIQRSDARRLAIDTATGVMIVNDDLAHLVRGHSSTLRKQLIKTLDRKRHQSRPTRPTTTSSGRITASRTAARGASH